MSNLSNIESLEERFYTNLSGLCDFLTEEVLNKLYEEKKLDFHPGLLKLGLEFIVAGGKNKLLENFVLRTHTYWNIAKERNLDFFRLHAFEVFSGIPEDKIKKVSSLFDGGHITDDNMDMIWRYSESMVKIAIKWIHEKRSPHTVADDSKSIHAYREKLFSDVKLNELSKSWNVKLAWPC